MYVEKKKVYISAFKVHLLLHIQRLRMNHKIVIICSQIDDITRNADRINAIWTCVMYDVCRLFTSYSRISL